MMRSLKNYPKIYADWSDANGRRTAARTLQYFSVAFPALLLYDAMLTLPAEVNRVWRRKFSSASALYIALRFSGFALELIEILDAQYVDRKTVNIDVCRLIAWTRLIAIAIAYVVYAFITILRAYGVSRRDWRPLLLVVPLSCVAPTLALMRFALVRVEVASVPSGQDCNGYYTTEGAFGKIIATQIETYIACGSIIGANCVLLYLTWSKTIGIKRDLLSLGHSSPVLDLLLRDGTLYFLFQILDSVIKITSDSFTLMQLYTRNFLLVAELWILLSPALTCILLSRFLLTLRGIYFPEPTSTGAGQSSIRFNATRLLGNLGAPVDVGQDSDGEGGDGEEVEDSDGEVIEYASDPFGAGMRSMGARLESSLPTDSRIV